MNWLVYLYYIFALAYVFLLPSYVVGKTLYPRERLAVRMGLGMVFSVTVVPALSFGLAMALSTHFSEVLLFTVASIVTLAGLAVQVARLKKKTRRLEE